MSSMSSPVKQMNPKTAAAKEGVAGNVQAGKTPKAKTAGGPTLVEAPRAVIVGPVMRKKELLDTVVERSGIKKKDAKPVVEAMLEVLGEALGDNRELNLLPLGKVKVINEKDLSNGKMMRVKIRQVTPSEDPSPRPKKTKAKADTDESDV